MRDRGIGADHEVETRHDGGRIKEGVRSAIKIGTQIDDLIGERDVAQLFESGSLLKRYERDTGQLRERLQCRKWNRAPASPDQFLDGEAALPGDSDAQTRDRPQPLHPVGRAL